LTNTHNAIDEKWGAFKEVEIQVAAGIESPRQNGELTDFPRNWSPGPVITRPRPTRPGRQAGSG